MSYAVRNDGLGWRAVSGPNDCTAEESWQASQPHTPPPDPKQLIRDEINQILMEKGLVQKWQVESAAASVLALAIAQGLTEEQAYEQRPRYREAKDMMARIAALEANL